MRRPRKDNSEAMRYDVEAMSGRRDTEGGMAWYCLQAENIDNNQQRVHAALLQNDGMHKITQRVLCATLTPRK